MRAEEEGKDGEFGVPGGNLREWEEGEGYMIKDREKGGAGVREGGGGMVRWKEGEPNWRCDWIWATGSHIQKDHGKIGRA